MAKFFNSKQHFSKKIPAEKNISLVNIIPMQTLGQLEYNIGDDAAHHMEVLKTAKINEAVTGLARLKLKLGLAYCEINKYLKPQGLIEIELFKSRKITTRNILSFLDIFLDKDELNKNDVLVIVQFLSSFYLALPEKSHLADHLAAGLAKLLNDDNLVSAHDFSKETSALKLIEKINFYFEENQDQKTTYLVQQEKLIKKMQEINKLDEIKTQYFFANKKTEINQIRENKFKEVYNILNLSENNVEFGMKLNVRHGK